MYSVPLIMVNRAILFSTFLASSLPDGSFSVIKNFITSCAHVGVFMLTSRTSNPMVGTSTVRVIAFHGKVFHCSQMLQAQVDRPSYFLPSGCGRFGSNEGDCALCRLVVGIFLSFSLFVKYSPVTYSTTTWESTFISTSLTPRLLLWRVLPILLRIQLHCWFES